MAHYAFLDENNIVTEIIVGKEETELIDNVTPEIYYGNLRQQKCVRTSYNTKAGEHFSGKEPFRKNYAGIGFTYDEQRDAFIPPKPYNSWSLNETTCLWEPPTPCPTDYPFYEWNESESKWEKH
jgi:hypothetical protein